jgi:phenylacetate-CoA ligase
MSLIRDAEWMEPGALRRLQQASWQEQHAYVAARSDFYRAHWDGRKAPARLEDLPALPLTDKAMLRASQAASPPFGTYLAAAPDRIARLHRTSGTTGQAVNLALSAKDCRVTEIVGGRSHAASGLGPGHRVVHCLNYQLWMGGLTDHLTLEQTEATVIPFGVGSSALLVRTIRELGIDAISCTPSYPAVLEQVIAAEFPGLRPRDLGLRLGLFGGEAGLDNAALRGRLREVWGLEPRNANYGVSDVLSNFAGQCTEETDLHFLAGDVLYPELVDPESGAALPLEEGSRGELVLTHLERECQPLVRFRTGDIVAITATGACACRRTGPRFRVIGRSDDMVVIRGINVFPTSVAAVLNGIDALGGEYRIRLSGPGPYDRLPLEVEAAAGIAADAGLAARVTEAIRKEIRVSATVTPVAFGTLPRTEGKTRRVVRED